MSVGINVDNFATSIDLAKFNEVITRLIVEDAALSKYHNIITGVGRDRQIAFANNFGLIGKKLVGCTISESDEQIILTEKEWKFNPIGDRLSFCNATINNDIQLFEASAKVMPDWFTGMLESGEVNQQLGMVITKTREALIRSQNVKNWFSDTALVSLPNGVAGDLPYFTIFDGLYKQLFGAVPTGTPQHVEILQNAAVTREDQLSFSVGDATAILRSMVKQMTHPARQAKSNGAQFVFHCTTEFYQAYEDDLTQPSAANNQQGRSRQEDGITVLSYKGIDLIDRVDLSNTLASYYDNGTVIDKPNRVVLTTKSNIPVATLDENEMSTLRVFSDKKDNKVYIDFAYSQDVKLLLEELVVFAY